MADLLEIPEGWEGHEEQWIRHRVDRELESSLIGSRMEYEERRRRMPADVRRRDDPTDKDTS